MAWLPHWCWWSTAWIDIAKILEWVLFGIEIFFVFLGSLQVARNVETLSSSHLLRNNEKSCAMSRWIFRLIGFLLLALLFFRLGFSLVLCWKPLCPLWRANIWRIVMQITLFGLYRANCIIVWIALYKLHCDYCIMIITLWPLCTYHCADFLGWLRFGNCTMKIAL